MSRSEDQARIWIKKTYPGAFIIKYPDYKQTGLTNSAGIPDYLVIHDGKTFWIEVKTWKSSSYTPAQLVVFSKMQQCGAVIYVWKKLKRGHDLFIFHSERKD